MSMSFELVVSKLEDQLVWLGLLAPETPAHHQAWQLIEQLWAKLLAFTPRSEEMRMRLENIRVAIENAERGVSAVKAANFEWIPRDKNWKASV